MLGIPLPNKLVEAGAQVVCPGMEMGQALEPDDRLDLPEARESVTVESQSLLLARLGGTLGQVERDAA